MKCLSYFCAFSQETDSLLILLFPSSYYFSFFCCIRTFCVNISCFPHFFCSLVVFHCLNVYVSFISYLSKDSWRSSIAFISISFCGSYSMKTLNVSFHFSSFDNFIFEFYHLLFSGVYDFYHNFPISA